MFFNFDDILGRTDLQNIFIKCIGLHQLGLENINFISKNQDIIMILLILIVGAVQV